MSQKFIATKNGGHGWWIWKSFGKNQGKRIGYIMNLGDWTKKNILETNDAVSGQEGIELNGQEIVVDKIISSVLVRDLWAEYYKDLDKYVELVDRYAIKI